MPRKSLTAIPVAPVERLMIKAGAERVSHAGAAELCRFLEQRALLVAKEAIVVAQHQGRKTVQAADIEQAGVNLGF